jgi:aldehyde dehydrogenase (NAD+)
VRQLGNRLREVKRELGALVTLEMGKIRAEGEGEVQEMVDICDFACGLSRQLYGLSMHSERPRHRMYEQWHPLGVVGIISAFNFPVAVWSWNAALAAVCGDSSLWKPASKTPLTAIATTRLAAEVCRANGVDPAIFALVIGKGSTVGDRLLHDKRIPLVSATGSCQMGYRVGEVVGRRLGRTILELGGNNAILVTPHANLDLATRAILFGAVGTAGQRCTSTRRIIVHRAVKEELVQRLVRAYATIAIGNPLADGTLMGPLVTHEAVEDMQKALQRVKAEGGTVLYGGERLDGPDYPGGHYVRPCIAAVRNEFAIVQEETFAPILYIIEYGGATGQKKTNGRTAGGDAHLADLAEAIRYHNDVPQGLSSAIFTNNVLEAETFLSAIGSDCGIANVNIGTSGAEIGGAFGGEKETGGGRESGSDSWKVYMRRQTNTINWGTELPLAQGIKFGE